MAVSSYSPELIEVFRRAAAEEVAIGPFPRAKAEALRFRLNNLRAAMRKEQHRDLSLAERVTIKLRDGGIEGPEETAWVVCTPDPDRDFLPALKAAGIELPDYREDEFLDEQPQMPGLAAQGENVEKLLEDFKSKEGGEEQE